MSFLKCGICGTNSIPTDSKVSKYKERTFDVIDNRVAVRQNSIANTNQVVFNVLSMDKDPQHYSFLTVMGTGCFQAATVYLARHLPSDNLVAVKIIRMDEVKVEFNTIQNELTMHKTLRHPNLLPCLDSSFVHGNDVWTIFPLMGFGSCRDLIDAHFHSGLPELAIAYVLQDVLSALDYLHQHGLIHRAVKASHVLIASSGQVVLSGFHHMLHMNVDGKRNRAVFDFPDHFESCLNWASPELLEQNLAGYDTKSDIYGLGILICELANGIVPFSDVPATQMLLEKMEGRTPNLLDSTTWTDNTTTEQGADERPVPSFGQRTLSPHLHNLVEQCLQTDPGLRPSAAILLQHAFFRQVRRKSGLEVLPDLLQPITPLDLQDLSALKKKAEDRAAAANNSDAPAVDEVTQQIGDVAINNEEWSF